LGDTGKAVYTGLAQIGIAARIGGEFREWHPINVSLDEDSGGA
jgi:hypothetical protein